MTAEKGTFLAVDGQGEPGGAAFQDAIGQLYSIAYTTKFTLKFAGVIDFAVAPLGCLWYDDPREVPLSEWHWRLLIRVPDEITAAHIRDARTTIMERKGLETGGVKRRIWNEGRSLQLLHVGPYDQVGPCYEQLFDHAVSIGCEGGPPCHEIYLSDPRRVAPERLKTIVRVPIKKRRGRPS